MDTNERDRTRRERLLGRDVAEILSGQSGVQQAFRLVASELDVKARAEGIDADGLDHAARAADEGCPFSALIRASASVSVRAELAG